MLAQESEACRSWYRNGEYEMSRGFGVPLWHDAAGPVSPMSQVVSECIFLGVIVKPHVESDLVLHAPLYHCVSVQESLSL